MIFRPDRDPFSASKPPLNSAHFWPPGDWLDQELGLYYLRSRYYDPEVCRFINADAFVSTGQGILGYNMFAYCGNNPINSNDPTGNVEVAYNNLIFDDFNKNNIPDYLEIRWYRQTIRTSGLIDQINITVGNPDDKRCAVDCSVPFSPFETTDSKGNTLYPLDNPLYFYAVCMEIEALIRAKERSIRKTGKVLTGSLSFVHIYQEMKYHYVGYRTIPSQFPFYDNCTSAELNYDEDRLLCLPMYSIQVPIVIYEP